VVLGFKDKAWNAHLFETKGASQTREAGADDHDFSRVSHYEQSLSKEIEPDGQNARKLLS